ncbi:MAG: glycoside hydrolase family 88 protein, partial [Cytophagales bacterium]|nr:glycoside hydrolase family 88 protein [Cytophagales bacterium]
MKKFLLLLLPFAAFSAKPDRTQVLQHMHLAKSYFQGVWPDVTKVIVSPDKTRPSNIWTRAVFYEGLME